MYISISSGMSAVEELYFNLFKYFHNSQKFLLSSHQIKTGCSLPTSGQFHPLCAMLIFVIKNMKKYLSRKQNTKTLCMATFLI